MLAAAGLAAVAYHFTDIQLSPFFRDVFRRALGKAPFDYAFLDSREAAMMWLAEKGLAGS